jgi:hypothetical protein
VGWPTRRVAFGGSGLPMQTPQVGRAAVSGPPQNSASHRIRLISKRNSSGLLAGKWLRAPAIADNARKGETQLSHVLGHGRPPPGRSQPDPDSSPWYRGALRHVHPVPTTPGAAACATPHSVYAGDARDGICLLFTHSSIVSRSSTPTRCARGQQRRARAAGAGRTSHASPESGVADCFRDTERGFSGRKH